MKIDGIIIEVTSHDMIVEITPSTLRPLFESGVYLNGNPFPRVPVQVSLVGGLSVTYW